MVHYGSKKYRAKARSRLLCRRGPFTPHLLKVDKTAKKQVVSLIESLRSQRRAAAVTAAGVARWRALEQSDSLSRLPADILSAPSWVRVTSVLRKRHKQRGSAAKSAYLASAPRLEKATVPTSTSRWISPKGRRVALTAVRGTDPSTPDQPLTDSSLRYDFGDRFSS